MVADALANPVNFVLGAGNVADISLARSALDGQTADDLLADKGFDADDFAAWCTEQGMTPIIPPRKGRHHPRQIDKAKYKWRKFIEHTINKLKQCRAVATRYCKRARN